MPERYDFLYCHASSNGNVHGSCNLTVRACADGANGVVIAIYSSSQGEVIDTMAVGHTREKERFQEIVV